MSFERRDFPGSAKRLIEASFPGKRWSVLEKSWWRGAKEREGGGGGRSRKVVPARRLSKRRLASNFSALSCSGDVKGRGSTPPSGNFITCAGCRNELRRLHTKPFSTLPGDLRLALSAAYRPLLPVLWKQTAQPPFLVLHRNPFLPPSSPFLRPSRSYLLIIIHAHEPSTRSSNSTQLDPTRPDPNRLTPTRLDSTRLYSPRLGSSLPSARSIPLCSLCSLCPCGFLRGILMGTHAKSPLRFYFQRLWPFNFYAQGIRETLRRLYSG